MWHTWHMHALETLSMAHGGLGTQDKVRFTSSNSAASASGFSNNCISKSLKKMSHNSWIYCKTCYFLLCLNFAILELRNFAAF